MFSNNDIHKFILLLRKGFYPSEYMNEWETFVDKTLPEKDELYSNLNMENLTDQITSMRKEFAKILK